MGIMDPDSGLTLCSLEKDCRVFVQWEKGAGPPTFRVIS